MLPTGGTDPASRLLRLLALLQTGRAWPGPDLTRRLAVSARTLRRDVERLRGLGYTITAIPGPGGSYRLAPGTALPPLLFDDVEVTAVVAGLRLVESQLHDDAARRALLRLRQVLPHRLRPPLTAAETGIEILHTDPRPVDATTITTLADAAAHGGRVRFCYRDRHGATSTRVVDPHHQVHRAGRWYLLGVDSGAADWRVFRLDRVTEVERLPGSYPRRALPRGTVAAYLGSDLDQDGTAVSVVFTTTAAALTDRLPRLDGQLQPLSGDRCRYRTHARDLGWFAATTAALGIPFIVESPPELAYRCRDLARTLTHASTKPDSERDP